MAESMQSSEVPFAPEVVDLASLRAHPRNYRKHGPEQLAHIVASVQEHGFYRNVVIARDSTILAGHGVVEACRVLGMARIPVVRLDLDPDDRRALKVLTGDNEIGKLGEVDDRLLSELLKEISKEDPSYLLGTGSDQMQLANLLMVTRTASEISDFDAAAEWVGMPDYQRAEKGVYMNITFPSEQDRDEFVKQTGASVVRKMRDGSVWSGYWPARERTDLASARFEEKHD